MCIYSSTRSYNALIIIFSSLVLVTANPVALDRLAGQQIQALRPFGESGLSALGDTYPSNEYEYALRRDWLMEAERTYTKQEDPSSPRLNTDERTVDHYLAYLKWRDFTATKRFGSSPSRPIEDQINHIKSTEIYAALKSLPKGGNMHSHENHQLSKATLFNIVWESEDFKYLYMHGPNHPTNPWSLDFFINPPLDTSGSPWIAVASANYTKEEILKHQTLLGILSQNASHYPTDSGLRWQEINTLWSRCSDKLNANVNIKMKYLKAMYEQQLNEGVIYIETRAGLGKPHPLYHLDPHPKYAATNGRVYHGVSWEQSHDELIELTLDLIANFRTTNNDFVGHKRISSAARLDSTETWQSEMNNTVRLFEKYPDHVVGYDTVGEEDAGYSLLHFLENFLMLYNPHTGRTKIPLYLHSLETNWPDDLIDSTMSDDPVATIQNAYEVLLLGARRVGHGAAFIKHPYLMEIVRRRDVAMEICVVSNQILGIVPDLRNHPAVHFFRSGIPIVFGADDPGTLGYDEFTVDWYEAYMAWGLDLADLKRIALNSLKYSAMTLAEKADAIENKWRPMWTAYIAKMKSEACSRNYTLDGNVERRTPSFNRLLPRVGPLNGGNWVHIYGRNFERAICQENMMACRFNEIISTPAVYVSTNHVMCLAPDISLANQLTLIVNLDIRLDGRNWIPTNLNYTFSRDVRRM